MKNFIGAIFLMTAMPILGQTAYFDNFETVQTWTIFEELVAGNACYGNNRGEVARSTEVAHEGSTSLRVWSNKNASTQSNHVIAAHHISNTDGITGRLRVGMWAYCATAIGLTQAGPEFSLQSTRLVGGQNLTYIAGIQYIGNQWITDKWNIWHNGVWKEIKLSEFGTTLAINTWYYLELELDMTTNRYLAFKIQGGGLNETLDLTQNFQNATGGFLIGAEARNWTPSYFVTAESENLWTTCSQVYENKVYYDEIKVEQVTTLPVTLLAFNGQAMGQQNQLSWETATEINNKGFQIERCQKGGKNWQIIGFVNAQSKASKYQFIDNQPFIKSYYRLRQVDLNGKETFSNVIAVENGETPLKIYPTNVTDFLNIETLDNQDFQIINRMGQVVMTGKTMTPIYIGVSHLPKGIYIFKVGAQQKKFFLK
jgi:Secretion system C-terminal sorting domain